MKRLQLLDYGRLAAALCVLAFHYFFNGIQNGKISSITRIPEIVAFAQYGYLGVEFFFMISGYVIFFSAQNRSASQFAVSRLVRLYPAFWIAVLVTTGFALLWGGQLSVTPMQVFANLTMFGPAFGQPYVDGVYWTLRLELSFYALVLAVLLLGWQRHLASFVLAWPFVMLLALLAGRTYLPFAGQYYAFFAAGGVLAICKTRRSLPVLASLAACLFLCLEFACGETAALARQKGILFSPVVIGAVVCILFAFFAILNSSWGAALALPGSRLAGALTYPVYLIHAHIGYMLLTRFGNDANRLLAYPSTIALVLLLSYAIHVYGERRFAKQWHALFTALLERPLGWLQRQLHRGVKKATP
jgi:peptidoglycan/LPS O-acetylase OafA/YrhL